MYCVLSSKAWLLVQAGSTLESNGGLIQGMAKLMQLVESDPTPVDAETESNIGTTHQRRLWGMLVAEGLSADEITEAVESDDPKNALVEAIAVTTARTGRQLWRRTAEVVLPPKRQGDIEEPQLKTAATENRPTVVKPPSPPRTQDAALQQDMQLDIESSGDIGKLSNRRVVRLPPPLPKPESEPVPTESEPEPEPHTRMITPPLSPKSRNPPAIPITARTKSPRKETAASLSGLTVQELRQRAADEGVNDGAIEHARDGMDPTAELVQVILEQWQKQRDEEAAELQRQRDAEDASALRRQQTEQELQGLTVGELRRAAADQGVTAAAIEDARDAAQPRAELTKLVFAAMTTAQTRLLSQLSGLRHRELEKRASKAGATEEQLDQADRSDGDGGVAALIDLIVGLEQLTTVNLIFEQTKQQKQRDEAAAELQRQHNAEEALMALRRRQQTEQELQGMSIGEIRRAAADRGVPAEAIEGARDTDQPRAALTVLILATMPGPEAALEATLRQELSSFRRRELGKRASQAGATEEQLDQADRNDDGVAAFIDLIVSLEQVAQAGGSPVRAPLLRSESETPARQRPGQAARSVTPVRVRMTPTRARGTSPRNGSPLRVTGQVVRVVASPVRISRAAATAQRGQVNSPAREARP